MEYQSDIDSPQYTMFGGTRNCGIQTGCENTYSSGMYKACFLANLYLGVECVTQTKQKTWINRISHLQLKIFSESSFCLGVENMQNPKLYSQRI